MSVMDDDEQQGGVLLARVVIERYLDECGDRISASATDSHGESLDRVTLLGLMEFAKDQFLRGDDDG